MTELVGGLVKVRDGLSLIAFLALVLLVAFRTKKVPELFFGLVRDKLTRQQFSALLHRFMVLGFIAFLTLVALAALAQVLGHMTQPGALTLDDLRNELAATKRTDDEKIHAEAQYKLAMEMLSRHDLDGAIASLKQSIDAIPTLTAREMLTYLYRQKGDFANESASWEAATKLAQQQGAHLALVRLDNISPPSAVPSGEGEHDLIGTSTPFPKSISDDFNNAPKLSPGFYACKEGYQEWLYAIEVKGGQRLQVRYRSGPDNSGASASIAGTNGQLLTPGGISHGTVEQVDWNALESGLYFVKVNCWPNAVYRIQVD